MSNVERINRTPVRLSAALLANLEEIETPKDKGVPKLWMPEPAPQLPSSFTEPEFKALLSRCGNLAPAEGIRLPRQFWPAHRIPNNKEDNKVLLTHVNQYSIFRLYKPAVVSLQTAAADAEDWEGVPHEHPFFKEIKIYLNAHVASGGSEKGLLRRLVEGLSAPRPAQLQLTSNSLSEADLRVILRQRFALDESRISEMKSGTIEEIGVDVNLDAAAGFPFVGDKRSNLPEIVKWCNAFIAASSGGVSAARAWLANRPHFAAAKLMNKVEIYERAELDKKTRGIYVFSSVIQLPFSAVFQRIQEALPTVLESPDSRSAYGMSFSHGGADRFIKWLTFHDVELKSNEPHIRYALYGDDTYTAYAYHGKLYLFAADIKQLDAHCTPAFSKLASDLFLPQLLKHCNSAWSAIARLAFVFQFQHPVVLKSAYTYNKRAGVSSGTPGTTITDMVAVTAVWEGSVVPALTKWKPDSLEELQNALKTLKAGVQKRWGLVLKEETLTPQEIGVIVDGRVRLTADHLGLPFLGACFAQDGLSKDVRWWMPVYDQVKLAASFCLPKERYDGEAAKHYLLQRAAGLALLCYGDKGAVTHKALSLEYANLRRNQAKWPTVRRGKNVEPVPFSEMDESVGRDVYSAVASLGPNWPSLPSLLYFNSFFFPKEIGDRVRAEELAKITEAEKPPVPGVDVDLLRDLDEKLELAEDMDRRRRSRAERSKHVEPVDDDDAPVVLAAPKPPPPRSQIKAAPKLPAAQSEAKRPVKQSWADIQDEEDELAGPPPLPESVSGALDSVKVEGARPKHHGRVPPDKEAPARRAAKAAAKAAAAGPKTKKGDRHQQQAVAAEEEDEHDPSEFEDLAAEAEDRQEADEDEALQKRRSNTMSRRAAKRAQEFSADDV